MMDALTLHRLLLDSGARHEIIHLPRPISQADQLPSVLELPSRRCLAVRMYDVYDAAGRAGGGDPALIAVIVWAGRVPAISELQRITGRQRVQAASGQTVNEATGYAAGLVSPLALPETVEVYTDEDVVSGLDDDAVVYTATGESRTALGIRLLDLFALCRAKPAALGATGPAPAQHTPREETREESRVTR
jgi:prolyl-tRNA editing enzyme YbaK/EbsC (Cys-tRNA(Pro) deacylase)